MNLRWKVFLVREVYENAFIMPPKAIMPILLFFHVGPAAAQTKDQTASSSLTCLIKI
jgi:hypothetical protein